MDFMFMFVPEGKARARRRGKGARCPNPLKHRRLFEFGARHARAAGANKLRANQETRAAAAVAFQSAGARGALCEYIGAFC
jgi:hypothetical protein